MEATSSPQILKFPKIFQNIQIFTHFQNVYVFIRINWKRVFDKTVEFVTTCGAFFQIWYYRILLVFYSFRHHSGKHKRKVKRKTAPPEIIDERITYYNHCWKSRTSLLSSSNYISILVWYLLFAKLLKYYPFLLFACSFYCFHNSN